MASLNNGRFTVHSPNFANFGPSASYGAVATSTTWGERMLPQRRYFPTGATVLRWLDTSNITIDG